MKSSSCSIKIFSATALFTLAQTVAMALPTVTILSHETAIVSPRNNVYIISQASGTQGTVHYEWTQKSGPISGGTSTFNNPSSRITQVKFPVLSTSNPVPLPGLYVLQLKVSDDTGSTTQDIPIQVYSLDTLDINGDKLIAEAGSTLNCWLNSAGTATLQLNGSYWGTKVNQEVNTTVAWTQISGPASAVIVSPTSFSTAVNFTQSGTYVFQQNVTSIDNKQKGSDTIVVQVYGDADPGHIISPKHYFYDLDAADYAYSPDALTKIDQFAPALQIPQTPAAFLNKYFSYDFNTQYDYANIDLSRFTPPPPLTDPHPHPRILFNYSDLPDLCNRLANTSVGKQEMTAIKKMLTTTLTGTSATDGPLYNAMATANGNLTTLGTTYESQITASTFQEVMYEAFRGLIEGDTPGGKKAAAALATLAAHAQKSMNTIDAINTTDKNAQERHGPYKNWQGFYDGAVGDHSLALGYDFAYNFMDGDQRNAVRACLQRATTNQWVVGMDSLPTIESNRSNWMYNEGSYLLFNCLAVEGEAGSDANTLWRLRAAYDRMFNFGVSPDGAYYEGMGKGTISGEALVALAKRGQMLIASQAARNYISGLYLNSMETTGYGFTWDELNGGNNVGSRFADVAPFKYAFPTDPVIDFVAMNDLGKLKSDGSGYMSTTYNSEGIDLVNLNNLQAWDNLWRAIFATDPTVLNFADSAQLVAAAAPDTYFSNTHGLLITRAVANATSNARATNSLRLMFQPRSEMGGHSEPDRNSFTFSALGRVWAAMYVNEGTGFDPSAAFSTVRIDDKDQTTVPGKVIDFSTTNNFTYATGDATNAYNKALSQPKALTLPVDVTKLDLATLGSLPFTFNQTRLSPGKEPWADLPWGVMPDWGTSVFAPVSYNNNQSCWVDTSSLMPDPKMAWLKVPGVPVQCAFRTAGLVRGATPYALIVDDIQAQDGKPHTYTWRMMLGPNVTLVMKKNADGTDTNIVAAVNGTDVTLTNGTNHVLVRLLDCQGTATFVKTSVPYYSPGPNGSHKDALDITVNSTSPNFKVMLLPFTDAAKIPTTSWNANKTVLTVTSGTQSDNLTFTPQADGHNKVSFQRLAQ